ncbi:MAG TPA: hypothetical protein VFA15_02280 [Nitrososphaera sp.]|nr:hypothetical protein [Nitrososphaera sp.]
MLSKDGRKIACEITVTTGKEWELGNVKKCLAAGYETILVSADERYLKSLSRFIAGQLDASQRERLRCLSPEGLINYLNELQVGSESKEETVRGYKVRVKRANSDPVEMKTRREAIAKILAKSARREKDPPAD